MLRILIIWLGTFGIINIDLESDNVFNSNVFPIINIFYLMFLLKEFTMFLYSLKEHGTKGDDVNIGALIVEVLSLLHSDISYKYSGKLTFLGGPTSLTRDLVIQIEVACVLTSIWYEFLFIGRLLSE